MDAIESEKYDVNGTEKGPYFGRQGLSKIFPWSDDFQRLPGYHTLRYEEISKVLQVAFLYCVIASSTFGYHMSWLLTGNKGWRCERYVCTHASQFFQMYNYMRRYLGSHPKIHLIYLLKMIPVGPQLKLRTLSIRNNRLAVRTFYFGLVSMKYSSFYYFVGTLFRNE